MSQKIHFIGISGIGMSALAKHLKSKRLKITGSDQNITGHKPENIPENCSQIIYSLAIPEINPELREGRKRKMKCMSYPQALGYYFQKTKNICVIGTHGKTTTTGIIGKMLEDAKKNPTVIIGANVKEWKSNYRSGKSNLAVLESCEYKRAFLNLNPWIAVVTNIDLDHLDYYEDKKDYDRAFEKFLKKIPKDGAVIYHSDDPSSQKITKKLHCHKIAAKKEKIDLQIPGKHNQKNAALALALGKYLKINENQIKKSLKSFEGTMRRFELKGIFKHKKGKTKIYDDYGHHPAEIRATLQGAREKFPHEKILVIFQPHQYSRTKFFLKEFGNSFRNADAVLIPNIYAARDTKKDKNAISKTILAQEIKKNNKKVYTGEKLEKIKKIATHYDIVITMGAGDIGKIAEKLLRNI